VECAIGIELRDHYELRNSRILSSLLHNVNPASHLPLHHTSQLSAKRFGALFAFERTMDLDKFVETGVASDNTFAPELVFTIFNPNTSLHDGGIILRQGRIAAAGCVFPVSQRELSVRIHRPPPPRRHGHHRTNLLMLQAAMD
jgi:diadenylate cyclase